MRHNRLLDNICLFLVYCQTRNIPIHSFQQGYNEYKKVADTEDLVGVENFLQQTEVESCTIH